LREGKENSESLQWFLKRGKKTALLVQTYRSNGKRRKTGRKQKTKAQKREWAENRGRKVEREEKD